MKDATLGRALRLAVATGLRSTIGPALVAAAQVRPERNGLAAAAIGELIFDKLPIVPGRDTPLPLLARGVAAGWAVHTLLKEEGEPEPWAAPLAAVVAMGVAFAAPKVRTGLGRALRVPDPLLGLAEDYLALRLGSGAVGLGLEQVGRLANDAARGWAGRPTAAQSAGAGSM